MYFIENKVIDYYHGFINDGMKDVIIELKRLPPSPQGSKILLKAHPGYYKSFKYYQRINGLPSIEMYNEGSNYKDADSNNQGMYIISSKYEIIKDKKLTKVFDTKGFEIYKSKIF